jgi:oligoribonuclease
MRYVSLDLETSGSDPLRHQVLELAAVVEDTRRTATTPLADLPAFRRALRYRELTGTPGALAHRASRQNQGHGPRHLPARRRAAAAP